MDKDRREQGGGATFKLSFQILNVDTPVYLAVLVLAILSQTFVNMAFDRFKELIEHLHELKWR